MLLASITVPTCASSVCRTGAEPETSTVSLTLPTLICTFTRAVWFSTRVNGFSTAV